MSFMPVIATAPALIISPDNPERDMELTVVPEIYLLDAPPAPALPPEPQYLGAECGPSLTPKPKECARFKARGILLVPRELPPFGVRLRRLPMKFGKPVSCRIVIEFRVTGQLNQDMWRALKVPPPWRKAPRNKWKDAAHFPVRLYTYQPAELSKDQVEFLQAQISLMEIAC